MEDLTFSEKQCLCQADSEEAYMYFILKDFLYLCGDPDSFKWLQDHLSREGYTLDHGDY